MYKKINLFIFLILSCFSIGYTQISGDKAKEKSVSSDSLTIDQHPLKSTNVEVNINGTTADVTVRRVFRNDGKFPLDVIYYFPVSAESAIYGMQLKTGNQTIHGKIQDFKTALTNYEKDTPNGKSAALLEMVKPELCRLNVSYIPPDEELTVEIKYIELLTPVNNLYTFTFPIQLIKKFLILSDSAAIIIFETRRSITEKCSPKLLLTNTQDTNYEIAINIVSDFPIKDVKSSSDNADILYMNQFNVLCIVNNSAENSIYWDYSVQYKLADSNTKPTLKLYEGGDENFFLATIPPVNQNGNVQNKPKELIFIADVTTIKNPWGVFNKLDIDLIKKLIENLIIKLDPEDKFNIVFYTGCSLSYLTKSLNATPRNIKKAYDILKKNSLDVKTNWIDAVKTALSIKPGENHSRSLVLVMDNEITAKRNDIDSLREKLKNDTFFILGADYSINKEFIESFARTSYGIPLIYENYDRDIRISQKIIDQIRKPTVKNVFATYENFDAFAVVPEFIRNQDSARLERIAGKYLGNTSGKMKIEQIIGAKKISNEINLTTIKPAKSNEWIKYAWAIRKIQSMTDYNTFTKDTKCDAEIAEIGLKYRFLTIITAFLAMDSLTCKKYLKRNNLAVRDSDRDGILNGWDECPQEFGICEYHGCPEDPDCTDNHYPILHNDVFFDSEKFSINNLNKDILCIYASFLVKYPKYHLRLTGYCDGIEKRNEKESIKLSVKRAESVRNYLIMSGVDKKRIETRGYGVYDTNTSQEERVIYRSVEMKLFLP
jgi:Ca-activated chloride channel family protein